MKVRALLNLLLVLLGGYFWLLGGMTSVEAQTCTPASASLIGSADDELYVYINGNGPFGPIGYQTAGTSALTPISIPPGDFNATGPNDIAVLNQDTNPSVVESSWVITVTCTDGQVAYFTNLDPALKMYVSPCTSGGGPPPNDGSGNPWYSPNYSLLGTYFTGTPVVVTTQASPVWLQPMYNPQTGVVQPWISYNSSATDTYGGGGCTGLFYQESVTLNPQPYTPPTFSITKSANPSTIAKSYSAGSIAYKLIVCNSGAVVNTAVTVYDNPLYNIGESYSGPYYTYTPPNQMFTQSGLGEYGSPAMFIFPTGFPGNGACVTITYNMAMGDTEDAAATICALVNQASVTYNGVAAVGTAAVTITGCSVVSNTSTSTETQTSTKTPLPTSTQTSTKTAANTETQTNSITPSPTLTDTNTQTSTATIVNTQTQTHTSSPTVTCTQTNSQTVTNTQTSTLTLADTATMTNTSTQTNSITPSPTMTNTNTSTPTLADTATNTNTVTNSQTSTSTSTNTNTSTPLADTATSTSSSTQTNTSTVQPTNTSTSSSTTTSTATSTSTLQNSATMTNTTTSTGTSTVTQTFTPTNTPAAGVGFGKTVSETQAKSGDTVTYTLAVTVTGNSLTNPVITDVLPSNITFVSFGQSPTGTTTSSSGVTLTWTLPSTLAPGTYTLTYNTQVAQFAQANVPLTNNAQLNYSGGPTKSASVPITVIGNFSISVNIYNSAGEVVKTIPLQQFSTAITNITLSTTNMITTLQGPGSSINILYDGIVIGTWDGTNNQGQPVGNGTYKVQIDNISSSGTVTSVSQNATVNRGIATIEVDIFNEAGEIVRRLYNVMSNPVGSSMTNVTLSSHILAPNLSAPVSTTNNPSQVLITIQDTSSPVTLSWDGTTDGGSLVTPGEYQVQVHWTDGNGNTTNITKSVQVLPSGGPSGKVLAEPNEIKGTTTSTLFNVGGVSGASGMKVKIYTVAGELIQALASSTTIEPWTPNGLASGLYIASVEVDNANGGMIARQNLKILILH